MRTWHTLVGEDCNMANKFICYKYFIVLHTFINYGGKTHTIAYTYYAIKCNSQILYKGHDADSSFRGQLTDKHNISTAHFQVISII